MKEKKLSRDYLWYKLNACRYCSFIDDNSWRFLQKGKKDDVLLITDHMLRMEGNVTPKSAVHRKPEGRRKCRKSKTTWRRTFKAFFFLFFFRLYFRDSSSWFVQHSVGKTVAAVHFTTIPCKLCTAHKVQGKPYLNATLVPELTTLCMLGLNCLELFCKNYG